MITKFLDFVDSRSVVRRIVLGFTLYMTYDTVKMAWAFAEKSNLDGAGVGIIIAAITVPVSALQAFAFSSYSEGRK